MKYFITGGAGFIGSNLADHLLSIGDSVAVFDSFETGKEFFLKGASTFSSFQLFRGDIRNKAEIESAMVQISPDWVIHLAANADVRGGTSRPQKDLEFNTIGTSNVLEACRKSGCNNIMFSSTGSVYGEPDIFPTPENAPFPIQTSLYGASKLAGEGLISAYCFGFGLNAVVFRFVSILGPRYTHGHVFDFLKQLRKDSSVLKILGNGEQTKSYLHISDLIHGVTSVFRSAPKGFNIYNIGHHDTLTVKQSIRTITETARVSPTLDFLGGVRGWIGDSPKILLDTGKLEKLGWKPGKSLEYSVVDTVNYLMSHAFLMDEAE